EADKLPHQTFRRIHGRGPPYGILSHTWSTYEIPFRAFYDRTIHKAYPVASHKIYSTCDRALEDEIDYVWIDSCCIDKSSSAELSEAINSMYAWYASAKTCYAYLEGFALKEVEELTAGLAICRWFTRGWTLQELIAPREVKFYDRHWAYFGTRMVLSTFLSRITTIPEEVLVGNKTVDPYCVAQKMSWTSMRGTTRGEDLAYCLFGLFEINAPLLYGEGSIRAFKRLQEEIITKTNDLSLFAWQDNDMEGFVGVLAPSPSCYFGMVDVSPRGLLRRNPEFAVTNKGLRISTRLARPLDVAIGRTDVVFMPLNCTPDRSLGSESSLGISLLDEDGIFFRVQGRRYFAPMQELVRTGDVVWTEELIYIAINLRDYLNLENETMGVAGSTLYVQ
ncbi:HET-domain-containing protein, partial [Bimuria novae-zelandiae CBS 107.79]